MRLTRGRSPSRQEHRHRHVLFPSRDERGVHRLDDWDVDRLREDPERARSYARSVWFDSRHVQSQHARDIGRGRSRPEALTRAPIARRAPTNVDVLPSALELLADRLSVIPAGVLIRAGIDEELIDLIFGVLDAVRG